MISKTGKTTRIVDRCIQYLFKNGVCYVYEGRGTKDQEEMTRHVFNVFRKRMENEHPHAQYHYKYGTFDGIICYKVQTHNL